MVHMTAGHSALRGSGPGQKPAFKNALAVWVVLIAGSTGSALRAVRPANLHITPVLGAISSDSQRGRIIVSLARGHHRPGRSGELIGKRNGSNFGRPPSQQRGDPRPIPGAMELRPILGAMEFGIADDGECAGHEQAAQIAVPLFADTAEPSPTAARVLFGDQPDPG